MLAKLVFLVIIGVCLCKSKRPRCNNKKNEICTSEGTFSTQCQLLAYLNRHRTARANIKLLYPGPCVHFNDYLPAPDPAQPRVAFKPLNCKYCSWKTNWKCGNDLRNYKNTCQMCKAGKTELNIRHDGNCTDVESSWRGVSLPIKSICPLAEFYPCAKTYGAFICGSDGLTYPGICEMCSELGPNSNVEIKTLLGIC